MVDYKYGGFKETQIEDYKKKLHKKLFWLILYKDPNTKDNFPEVDDEAFHQYFEYLMKEIDGFNELLFYPKEIVEIMSLLEAAWMETTSPKYSWQKYRKMILDAHTLVDQIPPLEDDERQV